jgi:DNA-binding NarL/FixJ family response regulator
MRPMQHDHALEERDLEILRQLGEGRSLEAIARELGISDRTVRRRLRNSCDSIGVTTPIEAVVWAVRRGLL